MMTLFSRSGTAYAGQVLFTERNKPYHEYERACARCGGAGGADKWKHTGWRCFDCGGSGKASIKRAPLYTEEQIAKLNAAGIKREQKRQAKIAAAEEARRAPFLEWRERNAHVLDQIASHAPPDLRARFINDAARFVITPDWLIDVSIGAIVRDLAKDDERAASRYVGEIGKRIEIGLTCEKLLSYPAQWPAHTFYIALMRDDDGNRIVYKGSAPPLGQGEHGRFRTTIAGHDERDGEHQTYITRPKELQEVIA